MTGVIMCAPPAYSSIVLASSCVCMEYAVVEALGDVRISAKAIRKYRQIIPHNIAGIGLIFMIFGVNAANKVSKGYTILCLLLFREKNNINMADKKSIQNLKTMFLLLKQISVKYPNIAKGRKNLAQIEHN